MSWASSLMTSTGSCNQHTAEHRCWYRVSQCRLTIWIIEQHTCGHHRSSPLRSLLIMMAPVRCCVVLFIFRSVLFSSVDWIWITMNFRNWHTFYWTMSVGVQWVITSTSSNLVEFELAGWLSTTIFSSQIHCNIIAHESRNFSWLNIWSGGRCRLNNEDFPFSQDGAELFERGKAKWTVPFSVGWFGAILHLQNTNYR